MRSIVAVLTVLFTASTAQAQLGVTPGIGAGIQPAVFVEEDLLSIFGGLNIYFPLQFNENFRVEPSIAHLSTSTEDGDQTASTSTWNIGTGIFYTSALTDQTIWYVGPRIGLNFADQSQDDGVNEQSVSRTNVRLGASAGGEYFFSQRFSLGGEVQLNHVFVGEQDFDPDPPAGVADEGGGLTTTRALFFVRWYFGDMQF